MGLLKHQTPEVLIEFMNKCIETIASSKTGATITSAKILKKIIAQIKQKFDANEDKIKKNELSDDEQVEHLSSKEKFGEFFKDGQKLTTLMVDDLRRYTAFVNSQWLSGVINAGNLETVEILNMPFNHFANIEARLKMIAYLLKQAQCGLSDDHIDSLWEILVVKSIIPIEAQIFFTQLKGWIAEENLLTAEQQTHFFDNDIKAHIRQGFITTLNLPGFECIQSIFLSMNQA